MFEDHYGPEYYCDLRKYQFGQFIKELSIILVVIGGNIEDSYIYKCNDQKELSRVICDLFYKFTEFTFSSHNYFIENNYGCIKMIHPHGDNNNHKITTSNILWVIRITKKDFIAYKRNNYL